jgi:signal peptidase I
VSVTGGKSKKKRSTAGSIIELVVIVAVALGLALLIQAFLIKPFRIPSESMEPTLDIDQRVLVDRVSTDLSDPERGDILVFKPPKGSDENRVQHCGGPLNPSNGHPCSVATRQQSNTNFIKRVVAVPGDSIKVLRNRVYINGKLQKEPFIKKDTPCDDLCNLPNPITIPKGHYYMMGDNRGMSADSREWGPIPKDWIIGNAFFTYWPPGKIGTL